jgi:hypothetical protein
MSDRRSQESLWRFVRLVGLCALTIAQPLFDVLGHGADFFVARGTPPSEIVLLVALVYLGLPLSLICSPALSALLMVSQVHSCVDALRVS